MHSEAFKAKVALARLLCRECHEVGRRRVRTLMKRMGAEALYRELSTSRRNALHKIWPYLLRGVKIERANQAWALDTTYIPMARGFAYLSGGGLGEPQGTLAPGRHHAGIRALRRSAGRSVRPLRAAGHREHRSG